MTGKWRLLVAIPAVAGLVLTMGASAASAAPAHHISRVRMVSSLADIPSAGTVKMVGGKLEQPRQTPCTRLWIHGSSANLYLNAEGLNDPVAATSGHGDCWEYATISGGGFGEVIYSGSGKCLADNASIGRVVMQNCSRQTWQEWAPTYEVSGSIAFFNEYTNGLLATNSLTSGTYVYATGCCIDQWTEWYN
jgi:hypothetical protein